MSESSQAPVRNPLVNDAVYLALKRTSAIILPAIGALYFAVAQIWNLPKAHEVVGTIAAANAFVGALMGISTLSYNKSDAKYVGDLVVEDHPEDSSQKILVAHLNSNAQSVASMGEALFRVNGK